MAERTFLFRGYDLRLQAMQYVAEIHTPLASWRVLKTGVSGWYLFCLLDHSGCDTTIHMPVQAKTLQPDIRRALAHGWGLIRRPLRVALERPPVVVLNAS